MKMWKVLPSAQDRHNIIINNIVLVSTNQSELELKWLYSSNSFLKNNNNNNNNNNSKKIKREK